MKSPASLLALLCLAGAGPAEAACRPADLPPGVRADRVAGCRPERAQAPEEPRLRAGREPGFIDLGNGTEVRISGRARIEYEGRR